MGKSGSILYYNTESFTEQPSHNLFKVKWQILYVKGYTQITATAFKSIDILQWLPNCGLGLTGRL